MIGSGRPALMCAGGPGFAAAYMTGDAELLSGTLQSYLIDPHGSGSSTPPADPADYSPEGHARFYGQVRRALGLPRMVLLGHSSGAPWYEAARPVMDEWTERIMAASDPAEMERMMVTVLPFYLAEPDKPEVAAGPDPVPDPGRRRRPRLHLRARPGPAHCQRHRGIPAGHDPRLRARPQRRSTPGVPSGGGRVSRRGYHGR